MLPSPHARPASTYQLVACTAHCPLQFAAGHLASRLSRHLLPACIHPSLSAACLASVQRLKEQGWNVDRTERKMLMCGVAGLQAGGAAAGADGLQDLLAGAWLGEGQGGVWRRWVALLVSAMQVAGLQGVALCCLQAPAHAAALTS